MYGVAGQTRDRWTRRKIKAVRGDEKKAWQILSRRGQISSKTGKRQRNRSDVVGTLSFATNWHAAVEESGIRGDDLPGGGGEIEQESKWSLSTKKTKKKKCTGANGRAIRQTGRSRTLGGTSESRGGWWVE